MLFWAKYEHWFDIRTYGRKWGPRMSKAFPLAVAAASLVARNGRIALSGASEIIPYVAGSEVIRRTKMNPTLIPISRDQICDAPIGPARTPNYECFPAGSPGVASPHRTDARETHWPRKLEIKERSLRTCGGARPRARVA